MDLKLEAHVINDLASYVSSWFQMVVCLLIAIDLVSVSWAADHCTERKFVFPQSEALRNHDDVTVYIGCTIGRALCFSCWAADWFVAWFVLELCFGIPAQSNIVLIYGYTAPPDERYCWLPIYRQFHTSFCQALFGLFNPPVDNNDRSSLRFAQLHTGDSGCCGCTHTFVLKRSVAIHAMLFWKHIWKVKMTTCLLKRHPHVSRRH